MRVAVVLVACLDLVAADISQIIPDRIIGGSVTTINQYPFAASLLYSSNLVSYWQSCVGTILNSRSILSAAHCFHGLYAAQWRIRVGSSYANSGGVVHNTQQIIIHGSYDTNTWDNDISILRTTTPIVYTGTVAPASIAGTNYNLNDDTIVWAIGWGTISFGGDPSEELRHVQIWTVNHPTCVYRYGLFPWLITDNMLCSGYLDVGGRDQCQGDSGGPLLHNNVVVGIRSFAYQCALAFYPGVNTRVSRYTTWIQTNA